MLISMLNRKLLILPLLLLGIGMTYHKDGTPLPAPPSPNCDPNKPCPFPNLFKVDGSPVPSPPPPHNLIYFSLNKDGSGPVPTCSGDQCNCPIPVLCRSSSLSPSFNHIYLTSSTSLTDGPDPIDCGDNSSPGDRVYEVLCDQWGYCYTPGCEDPTSIFINPYNVPNSFVI